MNPTDHWARIAQPPWADVDDPVKMMQNLRERFLKEVALVHNQALDQAAAICTGMPLQIYEQDPLGRGICREATLDDAAEEILKLKVEE